MGRFSILPESWQGLETFVGRMCLLFAFIVIGPWAFLIVYDIVLYIWRSTTYEIPYIGGRARGKQRPRTPSLTERPSGHRRRISIPGMSHSQPPLRGQDHVNAGSTANETRPRVPSRLRE